MDAGRILSRVGEAMRRDSRPIPSQGESQRPIPSQGESQRPIPSRLVLLEIVRSARAGYEPWDLSFADYFDLNMLVTVGGKVNRSQRMNTVHK